jgi:catechol 2,3-dioxygenase-like lactoylglutathione lyase family enzyme
MSQLTPYLTVRDARSATAWYAEALGAHVVGEPYVMDDDRIGHAELDLGGARLYLADEHPELGLAAPDPGRVSVTLHLAVPDADAAVDRAAAPPWSGQRPTGRVGAPASSSTPSATAGCCRPRRRPTRSRARRCAPVTRCT